MCGSWRATHDRNVEGDGKGRKDGWVDGQVAGAESMPAVVRACS